MTELNSSQIAFQVVVQASDRQFRVFYMLQPLKNIYTVWIIKRYFKFTCLDIIIRNETLLLRLPWVPLVLPLLD